MVTRDDWSDVLETVVAGKLISNLDSSYLDSSGRERAKDLLTCNFAFLYIMSDIVARVAVGHNSVPVELTHNNLQSEVICHNTILNIIDCGFNLLI